MVIEGRRGRPSVSGLTRPTRGPDLHVGARLRAIGDGKLDCVIAVPFARKRAPTRALSRRTRNRRYSRASDNPGHRLISSTQPSSSRKNGRLARTRSSTGASNR
jgi:hypothetical protein